MKKTTIGLTILADIILLVFLALCLNQISQLKVTNNQNHQEMKLLREEIDNQKMINSNLNQVNGELRQALFDVEY